MNNFHINHRQVDQVDILEIKGELDAHTASKLEEALKRLIKKDRHNIIVNCEGLEYIASAGLGVFMAYIEDVRDVGGDIKLTNMNERIYNIFDLLGFPALYDILTEEKEAIERFNQADS